MKMIIVLKYPYRWTANSVKSTRIRDVSCDNRYPIMERFNLQQQAVEGGDSLRHQNFGWWRSCWLAPPNSSLMHQWGRQRIFYNYLHRTDNRRLPENHRDLATTSRAPRFGWIASAPSSADLINILTILAEITKNGCADRKGIGWVCFLLQKNRGPLQWFFPCGLLIP